MGSRREVKCHMGSRREVKGHMGIIIAGERSKVTWVAGESTDQSSYGKINTTL